MFLKNFVKLLISSLFRSNWENPPAYRQKKELRVAEIGWGIPKYSDKRAPLTGFQIRVRVFCGKIEFHRVLLFSESLKILEEAMVCLRIIIFDIFILTSV